MEGIREGGVKGRGTDRGRGGRTRLERFGPLQCTYQQVIKICHGQLINHALNHFCHWLKALNCCEVVH